MNANSVIIIEAMFVGIITVIIGHLSRFLLNKYYNVEEKVSIYESWNKNYIMEKQLYVTGLLIHILCQISGINHWYCKNGVACKN
jgi:hypothetical protein